MPHVDEGILHAYLDGALDALYDDGALPDAMTPADVLTHFDACADCRARLDIERDIRERAGLVLRDAAPVVHAPPLESLRTTRRAPPWVPYAWAASLIMAVGAGWWGSQVARDRTAPGLGVYETESVAQDAAPPPSAPAPPLAPLADAETAAPASTSVGGAARSEPQLQGFGADAQKAVASVAQSPVARESRAAAADSPQGRIAGMQSLQQLQMRQQSLDSVTRMQQSDFAARVAVPPPAAPPQAPAPTTPVQRFLRALSVMRAEGFAWRAATAADGIVAFGIDGATNTQVEVARAPDVGDVVRVRQRLRDGRDIELVQWQQPTAGLMREEARAANAANTIVDTTTLNDGAAQVIVQAAAPNTLVALRVVGADALSLAQRLVVITR